MSKELKGSNGAIVGSSDYFRKLHTGSVIGYVLPHKDGYDYQGALKKLGNNAYEVLEEIFKDLQKHAEILRYIPDQERTNLIKFIDNLCKICKYSFSQTGYANQCVDYLRLSSTATRAKSRASQREIETAAKLVKNARDGFSPSERLEMIRKAVDYGENYTAKSDWRKAIFLKIVSNGRGKEFLIDIWVKIKYDKNPRGYVGRCGKTICSKEYLEVMEKKMFFGNPISTPYDKTISNSLQGIANEIAGDLRQGESNRDYIKKDHVKVLKAAIVQLQKSGAKCSGLEDKAEKLNWFVGGDEKEIKSLQQSLNKLGANLLVDGVYGAVTAKAYEDAVNKAEEGLLSQNDIKVLQALLSIYSFTVSSVIPGTGFLRKIPRAFVQRIIWRLGAELYLRPTNCPTAAWMLEHSLQLNPADIKLDNSSKEAEYAKNDSRFQNKLDEIIQAKIYDQPGTSFFDGNIEIEFLARNLYFSLQHSAIDLKGTKTEDGTWTINCILTDRYNFDVVRSITKDLKLHISMGNVANDLGLFSQIDGVITPYNIEITFTVVR